jgi:hypothetical protein
MVPTDCHPWDGIRGGNRGGYKGSPPPSSPVKDRPKTDISQCDIVRWGNGRPVTVRGVHARGEGGRGTITRFPGAAWCPRARGGRRQIRNMDGFKNGGVRCVATRRTSHNTAVHYWVSFAFRFLFADFALRVFALMPLFPIPLLSRLRSFYRYSLPIRRTKSPKTEFPEGLSFSSTVL